MEAKDKRLIVFSNQPFWDISVKWQSELSLGGEVYRVTRYDMNPGIKELNTIPGFGQVGVIFSVCESTPKANVFGVLPENTMLGQHGVNHALLVHFRPGVFTKITGIPSFEIPAEGISLESVMPWTQQYIEIVNSIDSEAVHKKIIADFLTACSAKSAFYNNRGGSKETVGAELSCSIADYMKQNRGLLKISDLEDEFYYSKRTIESIVLRDVGITPKQLNLQTCLQTSIHIIKADPDCSISELANALQFHDQTHFGKFFKKMTGVTPAQFKRLINEQNKG